jgi:hypothetical protein
VAFRLRQELIAIICPTITIGTPTPTDNQRARAVNGQPAQNRRPTVDVDHCRRGPIGRDTGNSLGEWPRAHALPGQAGCTGSI